MFLRHNQPSADYASGRSFTSVPRLLIQKQGYHTAMIGQATDDTEMSLSLLRSLIDKGSYETESVILEYLKWANYYDFTYTDSSGKTHTKKTRPFGMGINTRKLFGQLKTIKGYINRYRKKFNQDPWLRLEDALKYSTILIQSEEVRSNQANGTLMRLYPLALLPDEIREQATIIDCQLTNPSIVNIDCSLYAVRVLRSLLLGRSAKDALNQAGQKQYHTNEIIETIQQALRQETRDISSNQGWILHSLHMAVRALNEFNHYDDAMDWIIESAGDTDTNASIAGAWLGASIGYENLLSEGRTYKINSTGEIVETDNSSGFTRNAYNLDRVLKADTLDGDYPRPEKYRLQDFDELVQAASSLAN